MGKTIEIDIEYNNQLIALTKKHKFTKKFVVEYLINLCVTYEFLENDWIDRLLKDQVTSKIEDFKEKFDYEVAVKLAIIKQGQVFKTRFMMLSKYIDIKKKQDPDGTISLIEDKMNFQTDENLLENMTEMGIIKIDGKTRYKPLDKNGLPILGPHEKSKEIIRCEEGFHTRNNLCTNCRKQRYCPIHNAEHGQRQLSSPRRRNVDYIPAGATREDIRRDFHNR